MGSERHSNSYLLGALAHRIRDHTVDSDYRENQSQTSQDRGQTRAELKHQQPVERVEGLFHGLYFEDWKIGGKSVDRALDVGNHARRIPMSAHLQDLQAAQGCVLGKRHVEVIREGPIAT